MGGFLPMIFQLAGYYIGGPVGAIIGSFVGAALFGTQSGSSEGPRLKDLKVQSSAYGAPIPLGFGCFRLSGNIIWSSGVREIETSETSGGGLLGGGATLTLYTYTVDLAVGICEGPVKELRRIWANGRLIMDRTGESDVTVPVGFAYTFYTGSETQTPDPFIEANRDGKDLGEGLGADGQPVAGPVPAYRGTAYVVIKNMELETFGNQVPTFEFEIVDGDPEPARYETGDNLVGTRNSASGGHWINDYVNDRVITISSIDSNTPGATILDPKTLEVIDFFPLPAIPREVSYDPVDNRLMFASGEPLAFGRAPDGWDWGILYLDTGRTVFGQFELADGPDVGQFTYWPGTVIHNAITGKNYVFYYNGVFQRSHEWIELYLEQPDGTMQLTDHVVLAPLSGPTNNMAVTSGYARTAFSLPPTLWAWRLSATQQILTRGVVIWQGVNAEMYVFDMASERTISTFRTQGNPDQHRYSYDPSRDRFWFSQSESRPEGDRYVLYYLDLSGPPPGEHIGTPVALPFGGEIPFNEWRVFEPSEATGIGSNDMAYNDTHDAIVILSAGDRNANNLRASLYNVDTGDLIHDTETGSQQVQSFQWSYSTGNFLLGYDVTGTFAHAEAGKFGQLYFGNPVDATGVPLADIVSNLCSRAGLAPTDYDVTELTDKVQGYVVARPMSVRQAIEPLMSAYFFDGVETGGNGAG